MIVTSSSVFITCIIAFVGFVQSDKPSNTLTELSKSTILSCCSERGSLVWKHQQLNNDGVSDQICSGQTCYKTGYSIDTRTPGCFHLIINSTSIDAAGLYQCNEDATGNVSGAYLVVYNFSCSDNFGNSDDLVEGDRVIFHCSMSWRGKWPFEIRWLDEHGIEKRKDVSLNPFDSSSLEVNVSRPNLQPYTVQFAFLNNGITDPNVDKSCPNVTWSSPIRNVKYPPSNIKLSCPDERCERRIDDTINCSADGFPIPELQWLDWDDKKIASGSVLELKSEGSYGYRCVATSIIRGKKYETKKNINVHVYSKPDIDSSQCAAAISCNNLIIALTVIVLVTIVGVVLGCLIRKIWVKKHAPSTCVPQQMEALLEQVAPLSQEKVPLQIKVTTAEAEGDKPSLPPGEQNDPNVRLSHKEYNNGVTSTNSVMELEPLGITSRDAEVCQPNDSEASEDEESGVRSHTERRRAHPETEGASLLKQGTIAETETQSNYFKS